MSDLLDDRSNGEGPVTPGALPNATAVLVLGIISIVGCVFYGVPGLICGIIALFLHKKDKAIYLSDEAKYENSFKTSKAGNVCAIIGTSLSAVYFVIAIIFLGFLFSAASFR
jgi:hypothetical protein